MLSLTSKFKSHVFLLLINSSLSVEHFYSEAQSGSTVSITERGKLQDSFEENIERKVSPFMFQQLN